MDWNEALGPLLARYQGKPHPLTYQNRYQLLVMVLLSAQDSDRHINALAPALFAAFPTMAHLARATEADLIPFLDSVRNHQAKIGYLTKLAPIVGTDEAIPTTHAGLTALPGLGPKSANVILRESHLPAEGIIVDLHVIRVAPRLGMALSFLGREICRPTNPLCPTCPVQSVCPSRRPL